MPDGGHAQSLAGQIQEEAEALVAAIEQAGAGAEHLAGLLNQANTGLATIEQFAANICRGATDHLDSLSQRLNEKLGEATSETHTFDGAVHHAADAIRQDWTFVETAVHQLDAANRQAMDALAELGHTADTALADLAQHGQALIDLANKDQQALESATAAGKASLDHVLTQVREFGDHWQQLAEQVSQSLQQDLDALVQSLNTHIGHDLAEAVATLEHVVDQIEKGGIVAPVEHMASDLVHTVTDELTKLADQAIDKLNHAIRSIIDDILHSKDHGGQVEKDMRAAFDELKPVFEEVEQLSHVVRDIAGIVGVDI